MKNIINTALNLRYIVILFLILFPSVSRGELQNFSELNISMTLLNLKDESVGTLSSQEVYLKPKKIIIRDCQDIQKLLASVGIYADGESIGIFYILNPSIDINLINEGTEIILPAIQSNRVLRKMKKNGNLMALTLDKKIKCDFIKSLQELNKALSIASLLNIDNFGSLKKKNNIIKTVSSIIKRMDTFKNLIKERTRPLSSKMIEEMYDEADKITLLLNNIILQKVILTQKDIKSIELINRSMKIRSNTLDETKGYSNIPTRWPEVCVSVSLSGLHKKGDSKIFRVYYIGQGLWEERDKYEKSFNKLTWPSEKLLPEADYYIWIGSVEDSKPLSEIKLLQVRKKLNDKIELDLAIK